MKRLQEQLQMYGVKTLSTIELIALVLSSVSTQGDPLAMASKLLDTYGVGGLKNIHENELAIVENLLARRSARTGGM